MELRATSPAGQGHGKESPAANAAPRAPLTQTAPPLPATIFDRQLSERPCPVGARLVAGYELVEELGQGGMGVVYLARQVRLDRLVALKMLRSARADREELVRFRAEAEAVARLHHPNIVQIHEVGEHDGEPYFSLEFCPGGTLDRYLAGGPLPPRGAALLIQTLARAVQHAHEHGVVHRDLKPSNVLLTASGCGLALEAGPAPRQANAMGQAVCVPKITDFGLAKRLDGPDGLTRVGAIIGTPPYMAPEQAAGQNDQIGPATDIYALGVLLYECLTGRPPFQSGSVLQTLEQIRSQEPVAPRALEGTVPRDLETICLRCLRKEPSRRYPSALALAEDLERWSRGEPIVARPIGPVERAVKWARRRPTAAALLAVSAALVVVLAAAAPLHIVRLRARVAEASAEAGRAQWRLDCLHQLKQGQEALQPGKHRDVEAALTFFASVARNISDEDVRGDPDLAKLRDEARRLERLTQSEAGQKARYERARAQEKRFFALRDEAFFELLRDVVTGLEAASPLRSREAALQALAQFPDMDCLPPPRKHRLDVARKEVLFILAEATARTGTPKACREALALLDRAGRGGAAPQSVSRRRARYLELLGRHEEASRHRARAGQTTPSGALDWFLAGLDRYQAGADRAALADLDRALGVEPELFWAQFVRGLALRRLKRRAEAVAALTLCIRDRPDFAWSHLLRAFLHLEADSEDHRRAAGADLDSASKCDLDVAARYVLLVNRGVLALKQKRADLAVSRFQEAARLLPDRYHAHVNLGQAYRQRREGRRALAAINHAIDLAPRQVELYRIRAELHRDQGQPAKALDDLDRAVALASPGPDGTELAADHRERARLLYAARRFQDALAACRQALGQLSGDPLATRLEAECLLELDRPREALDAFDRYVKQRRPDVELHRRRARAWARLGDLGAVVDEYSAALALRRDAPLLTARGWANLVNGAAQPALRDFQAALTLEPGRGDALAGRGAARVELGAWRSGTVDAEEALKQDPRSPRLLYNVARVLARAAAVAPADRETSRRTARALEVLREAVLAVDAGGRTRFWSEQVRRDRAFVALARTKAFASLERQFTAGARPRRPDNSR
jgi:tetratricopeptide (TPR) repeat protein